jgi:hypothetical protein
VNTRQGQLQVETYHDVRKVVREGGKGAKDK